VFFFSTEHVSAVEQFAFWHVAVAQTGMCLTPERDASGPFPAWIRWRVFGGVTVTEAAAPAHRLLRASNDTGPIAGPEYALLVSLEGDACYILRHTLGQRELLVRQGEALLVNTGAWTFADYADGIRWGAVRIPQRLLRTGIKAAGPVAIHFPQQAGLNALIADYARNIIIGAFDAAFETATTARGREIVSHLCGLLGLAIRDNTDPRAATPKPAAAGRLAAIDAYIDANCTDSTLSPATVAARFGISVRYLDKLFRRTGTSFMETLLQRRLSACCAMLLEDSGARPIAEIARRAGFTTLTQFNRRFRAAYGVTPRAWLARQR
jgi:AraC family transcriptional activator of tynA and feaB